MNNDTSNNGTTTVNNQLNFDPPNNRRLDDSYTNVLNLTTLNFCYYQLLFPQKSQNLSLSLTSLFDNQSILYFLNRNQSEVHKVNSSLALNITYDTLEMLTIFNTTELITIELEYNLTLIEDKPTFKDYIIRLKLPSRVVIGMIFALVFGVALIIFVVLWLVYRRNKAKGMIKMRVFTPGLD